MIAAPAGISGDGDTADVKTLAGAKAFIGKLAKGYGIEVDVELYDNPDIPAMAFAGGRAIHLLRHHWNAEALSKFNKEWNGLVIDSSPEGVLTHEFGHILVKRIGAEVGQKKVWRISCDHAGIKDERENINSKVSPSPYAMENLSEFQAARLSATE